MGSVSFLNVREGMDPKPETFGDWLRRKRIGAHLSLQDVATQADLSKQYLSNIERGIPRTKGGPPPRLREEQVDALAEAVFAPIAEARLAAGLAPPNTGMSDIDHARLLGYFNRLPEQAKSDVLAMIEALWRNQQARQKVERQEAKQKKKRTG